MRTMIGIQEGQFETARLRALEAVVRGAWAIHVGEVRQTIVWNIASRGSTITNRAPSRSTQIMFEVPDGFDEATRHQLLSLVERDWRAVTAQHPDQVMVAAFDSCRFNEILSANLSRFSALGKAVFILKTIYRLLSSRLRHGLLITSFDL